MIHNKFGTKSETLEYISTKVKHSKVLPLLSIKQKTYLNNKEKSIEIIQNYFKDKLLIIRSSCREEDTIHSSNAGKFESILNVNKNNKEDLINSIDRVFNSYWGINEDEEILIQPMLKNIVKSGVVFTCDIDILSSYYIINYDEGKKSDAVTSGNNNDLKTYIFFKDSPIEPEDDHLKKLIYASKEIERIFNDSRLDIEFGIDSNDDVYIFQVRPIVVSNKESLSEIDVKDSLRKIHKKIEKLSYPHPNLLGEKTVFGVMPDWNPAEIIGLRPKKLAISLYKELVTDSIWAHQRNHYGYRDLRSHPLMVSFLGVPYIDVRVTFNSFIPKELHEDISEKLVNYYINKLVNIPTYHDKVEFEVVHSCYYLDLPDKLKELLQYGFSENEIKRIEFSLLELTNNIINPNEGLYKLDIEKNKMLENKFEEILNSNLSIVDKIYWLIEDCKTYGTLTFAGVARAAFIGVQFLKSFVNLGIMAEKDYDKFMNSLNTINKQMNLDLGQVFKGNKSKQEFLEMYGHIRPGTYDITSKRYDENFEQYFNNKIEEEFETNKFEFNKSQIERINKSLVQNGIKVNAEDLISFIKESIEGREYTKYIFSKSLSKILQLIEEFGSRYDISRDDLAFLDIARVKELYSTLDHRDVKEIFMNDINKNKAFYKYTQAIKLPSIIIRPDDVYSFFLLEEEPNFITLKKFSGQVVEEKFINELDLTNKIIFIRSADPGYDFLFSKNIGGLVTQFGGANSHMAIRCAELGIPAVIGSGEKNFNTWIKSKVLEINCLDKQVRCI